MNGRRRGKPAGAPKRRGADPAARLRDYERRARELYEISKVLRRKDFSLAEVLHLILDTAVRLSNARYGALGVFDESGGRLADFLTVGIGESAKAAIGPLPTGRGLLGKLDWGGDVVRLKNLARHPAFSGFPPHHPPMRSFLGASIRADGRLFGRIYLTDKQGPKREFSALDERTIADLSVHASLAIEDRQYVERIQAAEALYWSTMASMPVSVVRLDERGTIQLANPRFYELVRLDKTDVINRPVEAVLHVEGPAGGMADLLRTARVGGGSAEWEADWMSPAGERRVLHLRVTGMNAAAVAAADLVLIVEDVTERKRAAQERQEREAQFRMMVEASPIAMAISRKSDGCLLYANEPLIRMVGLPLEDLVGRPALDFYYDPADRTAMLAEVDRRGSLHSYEIRLKRGDGALFWSLVSIVPLTFRGEAVLLVGVYDITPRKELEQQLRQNEKMAALGTLFAGVSHELNNPLFALSGLVELAREKAGQGGHASLAEDLVEIGEITDRVSGIVRRFLGVARQTKGRREPCFINELLEQALGLVANDLFIHNVTVRKEWAAHLPPVMADPEDLLQVFLNLFTNARQAMVAAHGKGTLTVSSSAPDGPWVEIRVADDGGGIAPAHLPRIFDPFFTTKPVGEGTGLGLALCHRIVTNCEGTITCGSEPGRGATFIIRLPAAETE